MWVKGWTQVEQGFPSLFAKFLMIFQSEACQRCCVTWKNHPQKDKNLAINEENNCSMFNLLSTLFWHWILDAKKNDFRDQVVHYSDTFSYFKTKLWIQTWASKTFLSYIPYQWIFNKPHGAKSNVDLWLGTILFF